MPYTATLYVCANRQLAKAVVYTAPTECHLLSGSIGGKMDIVERETFSISKEGGAANWVTETIADLEAQGFVASGQHLVASGMTPRPIEQGEVQESDENCFGVVSQSSRQPGWIAQMGEALNKIPGIPGVKTSQDQLSIQDGEHWITLTHGADDFVRGSYPRIPSANTAVVVLKIAQELKLNLCRVETGDMIDPMDISPKNWLLQGSQNWSDLEDFAAELGLVQKQIRFSKIIEGGDAFF